MRFDNTHCTEVEILSFQSKCKLDDMSYEQTVNVRTRDGSLIRLFDFMGFAVNESRLGRGKKLILCVPYVIGEVVNLESGIPQLLDNDFAPNSELPSRIMVIARILERSTEDRDLLVDAGFGEFYLMPDGDLSMFEPGRLIQFRAKRLDLLEILD